MRLQGSKGFTPLANTHRVLEIIYREVLVVQLSFCADKENEE